MMSMKYAKSKVVRLLTRRSLVVLLIVLIFTVSIFHHGTIKDSFDTETITKAISAASPIIGKVADDGAVLPTSSQASKTRKPTVHPSSLVSVAPKQKTQAEIHQEKLKYFSDVFKLVTDYKPESNKLERNYNSTCRIRDEGIYTNNYFSEEDLANCLIIPDEITLDLKLKHSLFSSNIPTQFPEGFYKGEGIVLVGGGKFSIMSYLAIKNLRDRGNTLPVEVFMPQPDLHDREFCDILMPKWNAKCIYLTSILPEETVSTFKFKGYQYKSLSLLLSSFEKVLLIDLDNFIMHPVDHIFSSEPFTTTGLVTWPDYWKRLISPKFYEIAGIEVSPERLRFVVDDVTNPNIYVTDQHRENYKTQIPFHDRQGAVPDGSTESGQLLIDKSKQCPTLLLSLYYNFYGPSHFYPIFNQGKAGEGDKDTFLLLLHYFKLPYYQVKKLPSTSGYFHKDGFRGVAMLQSDPVEDFKAYSEIPLDFQSDADTHSYSLGKFGEQFKYNKILFVHAHLPKFDPLFLYNSGDLVKDGEHIRMYTDTSFCDRCDFELNTFSAMRDVMCGKDYTRFVYLNHLSVSQLNDVCTFLDGHVKWLESHPI